MSKRAGDLIGLLEEYVRLQRQWEAHLSMAANGQYSDLDAEKETHKGITKWQKSLMFDCELLGFRYSQLDEIIPGPFKTTNKERMALLDDLKQYAEEDHE